MGKRVFICAHRIKDGNVGSQFFFNGWNHPESFLKVNYGLDSQSA